MKGTVAGLTNWNIGAYVDFDVPSALGSTAYFRPDNANPLIELTYRDGRGPGGFPGPGEAYGSRGSTDTGKARSWAALCAVIPRAEAEDLDANRLYKARARACARALAWEACSGEVYTPGFDGPLSSPGTFWCGGRGGGPATAGAFQCPHPSAI